MHHGETGIGWAIVGVERDGVLKHFSTALQVRLRQTRQVLAPAQVILIRGGAGLWPQHGLLFVLAKDVAAQGSGYAFGDFVLDGKDVVEFAIETARPPVKAGSDFNELNGDAQAVVGFANAAFEQSAYAEMTADCTDVSAGRPKLKRSGARGHAQAVDLGQGVDDFLGKTFAEVVLIAGGTHIRKGKNGDGGDVRSWHRTDGCDLRWGSGSLSDETISDTWHGLNVLRFGGVLSQGLTHCRNVAIEVIFFNSGLWP